MPKNKFLQKLRDDKGARAITITIVVMLLVLTTIIITTVIANRATDEPVVDEPYSEPAGVTDPDDTPDEPTPQPPEQGSDTDTLPSFLLPVSGVLQKDHDAELQVFSDTMRDYRIHLGLDIGTLAGASVSAMADGVITQVFDDVSMGKCIAIKHSGDAYTIYKNLAANLPDTVLVGKSVKAGDVIGYVGESAMVEIADEPHLHIEMTVNGLAVDPLEYLDEEAVATLKEDTNYEDAS